jgi:hypothetical protein
LFYKFILTIFSINKIKKLIGMKNAETTLDNLSVLYLNGKVDFLEVGNFYLIFKLKMFFKLKNKNKFTKIKLL